MPRTCYGNPSQRMLALCSYVCLTFACYKLICYGHKDKMILTDLTNVLQFYFLVLPFNKDAGNCSLPASQKMVDPFILITCFLLRCQVHSPFPSLLLLPHTHLLTGSSDRYAFLYV